MKRAGICHTTHDIDNQEVSKRMKIGMRKMISLLMAALLALFAISGCSPAAKQPDGDTAQTGGTNASPSKAPAKQEEPITIRYWMELAADKVAPVYKSMGETELYKELQERLNIKIEFLHPPAGQANEQFNLMIASRELPDVFERDFFGYPGGPEKAIADGIIIPLNDIIENHSPNFKKLLEENPEYAKMSKTDSGTYFTYPFIRGDDTIMVFFGPQFRKDFLDKVGLPVPETIDEWYNTLVAFRDKLNVEFPLSFRQNPGAGANDLSIGDSLSGAYGVARGFYVEDDIVKFGSIEPGYKEYLKTLNKWVSEKLVDPDFATQDLSTFRAKVTDNKVGAFFGYAGGGMGYFYDLVKENNPEFTLVGAPHPTLKKGEKSHFGQKEWAVSYGKAVITTANKYPEKTAELLDYGYGEEGHILFNFGIEGKSFNWTSDGYPKYTEWVTNNPEGKSMALAMSTYMRSHYDGPFVQAREYFEQFMKYPDQVAAVKTWSESSFFDRRVPKITATAEESAQLANIMNEVYTYVDEMFLKFVFGTESIDKFDDYVAQVKKMKIDEALKIQQNALERYNNR